MLVEKVTVRRANVVLQVPADQAESFYAKGYDIIDAKGNVLKESVPTNLGTLQKAFVEHKARIKELEHELEELKAETSENKRSRKKATE